jgi:hypothetical protein
MLALITILISGVLLDTNPNRRVNTSECDRRAW